MKLVGKILIIGTVDSGLMTTEAIKTAMLEHKASVVIVGKGMTDAEVEADESAMEKIRELKGIPALNSILMEEINRLSFKLSKYQPLKEVELKDIGIKGIAEIKPTMGKRQHNKFHTKVNTKPYKTGKQHNHRRR